MKDYKLISGGANMYYESSFELHFQSLTMRIKRKNKIKRLYDERKDTKC